MSAQDCYYDTHLQAHLLGYRTCVEYPAYLIKTADTKTNRMEQQLFRWRLTSY